jgi:hypothetical protein
MSRAGPTTCSLYEVAPKLFRSPKTFCLAGRHLTVSAIPAGRQLLPWASLSRTNRRLCGHLSFGGGRRQTPTCVRRSRRACSSIFSSITLTPSSRASNRQPGPIRRSARWQGHAGPSETRNIRIVSRVSSGPFRDMPTRTEECCGGRCRSSEASSRGTAHSG